jgi:hypothetical protein
VRRAIARTSSRRFRANWRTLLATISSAVGVGAAGEFDRGANRRTRSLAEESAAMEFSGVFVNAASSFRSSRGRGRNRAIRITSRQPPRISHGQQELWLPLSRNPGSFCMVRLPLTPIRHRAHPICIDQRRAGWCQHMGFTEKDRSSFRNSQNDNRCHGWFG